MESDGEAWWELDMDEVGLGTDGVPLQRLEAAVVPPPRWPFNQASGYGAPLDCAARCRGGDHASVCALLAHSPRLLVALGPCGLLGLASRLLRQLVVYDVPGMPLVRVGAAPRRVERGSATRYFGDGGYVMVSPRGCEVCYSYGVSQEVSFDAELVTQHGLRLVRQFDMTLGGAYTPPLPQFTFYDEGLGASRDAAARLDTLESHVRRFGELDVRKVLQCDVEGAEWEALWACPGAVLDSFDHLVIEFHGLDELASMGFHAALLEKLNVHFVVVHVHVNNHGLDVDADAAAQKFTEVLGTLVPRTLEVSYLSRRLVPDAASVARAAKAFPTPLDYPNVHAPDVMLNVWPWALPAAAQT